MLSAGPSSPFRCCISSKSVLVVFRLTIIYLVSVFVIWLLGSITDMSPSANTVEWFWRFWKVVMKLFYQLFQPFSLWLWLMFQFLWSRQALFLATFLWSFRPFEPFGCLLFIYAVTNVTDNHNIPLISLQNLEFWYHLSHSFTLKNIPFNFERAFW